ncbi:MAG: diacylglycerol kinase [Gammaproteobacteria bacterium]|nr:MAG: diacylglycerol kinase [Gammaproteobacteria bacterium]
MTSGLLKEIRRLIRASGYSIAGLKAAFHNEAAFRLETGFFVILAPLGLWLGDNALERALLAGSLFLVLIVEVVNSSIEAAIDRIGTEHHALSGRAKDMGSAAVFLALVNAVLIWGMMVAEKIQ